MRLIFYMASLVSVAGTISIGYLWPWFWLTSLIWLPLILLGIHDITQKHHTILKNFPLIGHFRYLLEMIRPEINQYFIENNSDGKPFSREQRSLVYQRSKNALQTLPFGTQRDIYASGYEWLNHSMNPSYLPFQHYRSIIGGPQCTQPYSASLFNISAMSYGSLSKNAILSLNGGAKLGQFFHNTGEGGLSPYHLENGGDLVWQIGTGYFGCRTLEGKFSPEKFAEKSQNPNVKMIEIKLSQGAKPGHGGILPGIKVTSEIAQIRGVQKGKDVISPPGHSAFSNPIELLEFIKQLRELSNGKPIGIKLCLGSRREFMALCKAMIEKSITPDFITIDGGEGGTGAAPLEFSNYIGFPLKEALIFIHNTLVGFSLRKKMKIIVSGKNISAFDIISKLCLGADICNSARGMLFAIGCIQALRCNSNECPTGIATQDPSLVKGLVVKSKIERVANYHKETLISFHEILGSMGLVSPEQLRPYHLMRRTESNEAKNYSQLYDFLEEGSLFKEPLPFGYAEFYLSAKAESFNEKKETNTPYSYKFKEKIAKIP